MNISGGSGVTLPNPQSNLLYYDGTGNWTNPFLKALSNSGYSSIFIDSMNYPFDSNAWYYDAT